MAHCVRTWVSIAGASVALAACGEVHEGAASKVHCDAGTGANCASNGGVQNHEPDSSVGGSGGASTGGMTTVVFGGGGTSIPPPDASVGCAAAFLPGEREMVSQNFFFVVDRSGVMACTDPTTGRSEWSFVKDALEAFASEKVQQADDVSMGIDYFGKVADAGTSSCDARNYFVPDVDIAPLPGNLAALRQSLDAQVPSSDAPTTAALTGALVHATDYKSSHPGASVLVVLITGAEPETCAPPSNLVDLTAAARAHGISTFVMVLPTGESSCGSDAAAVKPSIFDTAADAGGTMHAIEIEEAAGGGADLGQRLLAALDNLRDGFVLQVPCSFQLPTKLDPDLVNVEWVDSTGAHVFYRVADATACSSNGDWYYGGDPPTTIELCPATCETVKAKNAQIDIELGCGLPIPPI